MRNILSLVFLFFSSLAFGDDWLCSEVSSERRGDTLLACGIGEDASESVARSKALKSAMAEFKDICDASDDCANHAVVVTPKRTSCANGKCYRLVSFQISTKKIDNRARASQSKQKPFKLWEDQTPAERKQAERDYYAKVISAYNY